MDNRSIEQIAAAESPEFAATSRKVAELERLHGFFTGRIASLQGEIDALNQTIERKEYQSVGPMTLPVLRARIQQLESTLADARNSLADVIARLPEADGARDRALADFQAQRSR